MRLFQQNPEKRLAQKRQEPLEGRVGKRPSLKPEIKTVREQEPRFFELLGWMYGHTDQLLHPDDVSPYMREVIGEDNYREITKLGGWTIRTKKNEKQGETLSVYARDLEGREIELDAFIPSALKPRPEDYS